MKGDWTSRGFSTRAIHAGQHPDPATGSVNVPIYATSTYVHDELGRHKGFEYARVQNPTRFALEANVASLEGGASGHAFASGMAAIATLMTLVKSGEHVVLSRNVYGGTYRFMTQVLSRYGVRGATDPGFRRILATGIKVALVLIVPATVALIVFREPIVRLLFQRGAFGDEGAALTSQALLWYAPQLPFVAVDQLLIAGFYALQNTRLPVLVGVACAVLYSVAALATDGVQIL